MKVSHVCSHDVPWFVFTVSAAEPQWRVQSYRGLLDYIWLSQTGSVNYKTINDLTCQSNCNSDHCKRLLVWVAWPELNSMCLPNFIWVWQQVQNKGKSSSELSLPTYMVLDNHVPMRNLLYHWSLTIKHGLQTHSISIDRNTISLCCSHPHSGYIVIKTMADSRPIGVSHRIPIYPGKLDVEYKLRTQVKDPTWHIVSLVHYYRDARI